MATPHETSAVLSSQAVLRIELARMIGNALRATEPPYLTHMQALGELALDSGAAATEFGTTAYVIAEENGLFDENAKLLPPPKSAIDSRQPTFAGRAINFPSMALLAGAADLLRADGESICNVVILPHTTLAYEWQKGQSYYAKRGTVVHQGQVYGGDFKRPVRIHGSHTNNNPAMKDASGIALINTPQIETLLENKLAVHTYLAASTNEVAVARTIAQGESTTDPELRQAVRALHATGKPFVLKPAAGNRGHGVYMVDPRTQDLSEVIDSLDTRYAHDKAVIVEPWIQSYPLYDTQSGVHLDWNIRTIISGGKAIGSYARIGAHGSPVNIAQGAEAWSLQSTLDACKLSKLQQELVHSRLDRLHKTIAATVPAGQLGVDIIINEQLEPIVNELNGEDSGGLANIIHTSKNEETDWQPAIAAIRNISNYLFGTKPPKIHIPLFSGRARFRQVHNSDIIGALYEDPILKDPKNRQEAISSGQKALKTMPDSKSRQQLQTFVNFAKWQSTGKLKYVERIDPTIVNNSFIISRTTQQLFTEGRYKKACAYINRVAASEPHNLKLQQQCAELIMDAWDSEDHAQAFEDKSNPEVALAAARALFYKTLDSFDMSPLTFTPQTQRAYIEHLAESVEYSLDEYKPFVAHDSSGAEQRLLAGIDRFRLGMYQLDKQNSAALSKIIEEAFLAQTPTDCALANAFVDTVAGTEAAQWDISTLQPSLFMGEVLSHGFFALASHYVQNTQKPLPYRDMIGRFLYAACENMLHRPPDPAGLLTMSQALYTYLRDPEQDTSALSELIGCDASSLSSAALKAQTLTLISKL